MSAQPPPSVDEEDRRHLHRELFMLTRERTRQINRIKGLLALHGIAPAAPPRWWNGRELSAR